MALSGVHIAFGGCSIGIYNGLGQPTLLGECSASETLANAGTSTITAPPVQGGIKGQPTLSISASAAIFYAVGTNPDATNGPRRYMDPVFGREDIFCSPGDKFAWIAA